MNNQLYKQVLKQINRSLYDGYISDKEDLTPELIEDCVADTAEYHDEQNNFKSPYWSDIDDVAEVTEALCSHFNLEYQ